MYGSGTEWGNDEPTDFLSRYVERLPARSRVLDLGCGNGRNSIYLAKCGFDVTAIDASSVAVNQLLKHANEEKLSANINTICADITNYQFKGKYDLILLYGVINSLEEKHWPHLLKRMKSATKCGGLNIIAYFNNFSSSSSVDGTEVISLANTESITKQYREWTLVDHDCRTNSHTHGIRGQHSHVTERATFCKTEALPAQTIKPLTVGVIGPTKLENPSLSIHIPRDALFNAAQKAGQTIALAGHRLACIPDAGVGLHVFNSYNESKPSQRAKIFSPMENIKLSNRRSREWLSKLKYDAEIVSVITWEEQAPTLLRHVDIVVVVGLSSGTLIEILWTKWIKRPVYLSLDLCSHLPAEVRAELNLFELPTFDNLLEFMLLAHPSGIA